MKALKLLTSIAVLLASSVLHAADTSDVLLSHYEPLQQLNLRSDDKLSDQRMQQLRSSTSMDMSFNALGRNFELQLEPNERLLAAAPRAVLQNGVQILRGQLQGRPESWARIVVFDGMPRGLIWDGEEMFAVEAPGDALLDNAGPIIYRLADAMIAPGAMTCASGPIATNGAVAINKLVNELSAVSALAPGAVSELTMGAVGDFEFTNDKGGDAAAAAAITTRLNNVDGIFSEQLGVQINVQTIDTYNTAADPFTDTGDAGTLLDELSLYRSTNASQNAHGLTHLYTGRNLDTSTVGIAWRGALCSDFFGAGLSEGNGGATFDSLIAAHEIGHNFGAPHDGQAGSACEAETGAFLMAPQLNNSDQFSSCSIAQMQAEIASASCVVAIPAVDMSVELSSPSSTLLLGANMALEYGVSNNGTLDATNVSVDFTIPANLTLGTVTTTAGTCSSGAGTVNCVFGTVAGQSSETVTINVVPTTLGAGTLNAAVTADTDDRPANNQEDLQVTVDPAVDLVVNTPTSSSVLVNSVTTVMAVLENQAVLDASGVSVSISLSNGLQANAASWSIGTCTVTAQQVDCQASNFSAQSSSSLSVDVRGISEGSKSLDITLSSVDAEANPANNSVIALVRVNEPADKDEGGGSTAPLFLLMLAMVAVLVRRKSMGSIL